MKLLFENWRKYLKEIEFHDSPDEDQPGNKQIIVFNTEETYEVEGSTHGAESHMIKHYIEFERDKVLVGLKRALQKALDFNNFFLKDTTSGEIIASGDEAKKTANEMAMLNTFDYINDKLKNNESLTDEEKQLVPIIFDLSDEYQQLIDSYISSGIDLENITDTEEIKQILDAGEIVKFVGSYKGDLYEYYLNTSNTGLIAYKDDKVATLFRIDKKGNNLSKVSKYFSRGVELQNPAFAAALASYVSAAPEPEKQPEPEEQRQKQKSGPGDIVRRLKQAGKPDEQIRQILAKAFPQLPEEVVSNILTNINI